MQNPLFSLLIRYGVAVASMLAAVGMRLFLNPVFGDDYPFALLFFAVLFSAWYGGFGPALVGTALGAIISARFLLPPYDGFVIQDGKNVAALVLYSTVGLGIAIFGGAMRRQKERAEESRAAALLQREELRITLQSIGDGVIVTDAACRVASLNPVAEALTGWTSREAQGKPLDEVFIIVNERSRQAVENPAARALREGGIVALANHTILIAKDGAERPIDDSAAPIRNPQGEVVGVVLVFRDVTERRRAAEARRHLAAIVEFSEDAIIGKDLDGKITSWNAGAETVYGYRAEEVIGKPFSLFVPEDRSQEAQDSLQRIKRGEQLSHFETVRRRKDGARIDVSVSYSPIKDADGELIGTSVITRDVTERIRAETAIRERQRQLQLVADNAPVLIAHCDTEHRFKFVNKPYAERFGLHPRDVIGRTIPEMLGEEAFAILAPHIESVLAGRHVEFEAELPYRLTAPQQIYCAYEPEFDAEGKVVGYIAAISNITERKRVESTLREVEARFAAIVNYSPACIFAKDRSGRFLLANAALARLMGCNPEDIPGKTDADFFSPDICRQFARDDAAVFATGESLTLEESFPAHGATLTALTVKFPLRDAAGNTYAVCGIATDVTDLKRAEEALQAAADRLSLALAAGNLGDWSWDAVTDVVTLSGRAAEIFGIPPGPHLTWTQMQEMLDPDHRALAVKRVSQAITDHSQYHTEYRVNLPSGEQRWVAASGQAYYAPSGEPLGMYGVLQDITEQKRVEESVREEARISETLYRVGKSLAAELDLERVVQNVTDEATALTGAQFGAFFYNVNDARGESYTLYSLSGVSREAFAELPMPRNTPIFGPTFRGEGVVRLDDVTTDPRYGQNPPHRGIPAGHLPVRSYLAVPVVSRSGAVLGGLFFGHSAVGVFTARHERLVIGIAAQAAVAIDNARLYREVRETEARLAAIVNYSPATIFLKDRDGRYLLVNQRFEELAQASGIPGPYLGKTDGELLPPELAEQFRRADLDVVESKRAKTFEETLLVGGESQIGLTTKFPLMNEAGDVYALCGITLDITERRRAHEAVRESEERLRLALDAGRMGVWDWNIETNEIRWSENLEPIHGLAPGTFGGTLEAFHELIYPDDREMVQRAVTRALDGGTGYALEFRSVWPDGSVHWMAGKGKVYTTNGRAMRMIGVGMDITDRKRVEQDMRFLADASATLAALIDYGSTLRKVAELAVPSFADWCSVDILDESGALKRLAVAHVDPAKVELAHQVHRKYPADPRAATGVWNIIRTGKAELFSEITDEMLAASVKQPELLSILHELGLKSYMGVPLSVRGRVLGVITFIAAESGRRYTSEDLAVAEDLAHRAAVAVENARLYQEVREADRKKDEFLAVLGHELRNPLAPISNALQILKLPGVTGPVLEEAREMMERQVHYMVRLVDDLLDVSRIVRGKVELRRETVDVATVVTQAIETSQPFIDAEEHALTVELPSEPLRVSGDPVRLAQVVANLLNNAARYTERRGKISVSARREGNRAVIRVLDTGIGIAPETLSQIWDMFVQADRRMKGAQGGMGIGLTLVKSLVEMHGGEVAVSSAGLGKGSEFAVSLPLLEARKTPSHGVIAGGNVPETGARRILVVDDNVDAAQSLAMLLRVSGHPTQVAHDGQTALRLAEADPPEVAFLDIGMPGMDGYELARRFRDHPRLANVLLVALTGWGQEEDRRRTRNAGFDIHEVKPVGIEALQKVLARQR